MYQTIHESRNILIHTSQHAHQDIDLVSGFDRNLKTHRLLAMCFFLTDFVRNRIGLINTYRVASQTSDISLLESLMDFRPINFRKSNLLTPPPIRFQTSHLLQMRTKNLCVLIEMSVERAYSEALWPEKCTTNTRHSVTSGWAVLPRLRLNGSVVQ